MKIGSQVHVRGSIEAVEMYCKAFGAEITFQIKSAENAYEVLCEGGKVLHLGPRPWSTFCTDIVDKFGVFWWVAI